MNGGPNDYYNNRRKKHGKNFIAIDLEYPNLSNIKDAKNEALMLATILFRFFSLIGKCASGITIKIYTDYPSEKNFCIDAHCAKQITNREMLFDFIDQTFQDISSNYNDIKFLTVSLYLKNQTIQLYNEVNMI